MVLIGSSSIYSLDGYASYPRVWRRGGDAILGFTLPSISQSIRDEDFESSALLANSLRKSPAPVSILTIGTMTNLELLTWSVTGGPLFQAGSLPNVDTTGWRFDIYTHSLP